MSGNDLDDADPDAGEAGEAKAERKSGGPKGKAKAKAKGKRTLDAPEGVTTPQKEARIARTPETGEKMTASVQDSGGNSDKLLLGCSKCRYSKRGCARCNNWVRVGRVTAGTATGVRTWMA